MARAHFVKKARKANKAAGIKVGDSYYWWKFRTGGRGGIKHYSKISPKPSQLTQSEFLRTYYSIQESLEDDVGNAGGQEDFEAAIATAVGEIESLRDETEGKRNNMPDQLQNSETGQLMEERYNALDQWANNLQAVDCTVETVDGETDEETYSRLQGLRDEIAGCDPGIS